MSDDNIDLMLRHWMENVSQRLDKMSDTLECLRDRYLQSSGRSSADILGLKFKSYKLT